MNGKYRLALSLCIAVLVQGCGKDDGLTEEQKHELQELLQEASADVDTFDVEWREGLAQYLATYPERGGCPADALLYPYGRDDDPSNFQLVAESELESAQTTRWSWTDGKLAELRVRVDGA